MSEPFYKVVFTGTLMPGFALDTVKSNLATLFKSDLGKINHLFTGRPVVLKRELTAADADKYLTVLRNAGAMVSKEADLAASLSLVATEEEQARAAAAAETTHSAEGQPSMTCPKCGHVQAKAPDCEACGIIIEKYRARQAEMAAFAPAATVTPGQTPSPASPYTPPQSSVAEAQPEYGELNVFTTNGRIGRLRYLAWSLSLSLLMFAAILLAVAGYAITPALGYLFGAVAAISAVVVGIMIGVQRLHDIGWSGWLLLLSLIPYLGSLFSLVLLLMPGSKGGNRYGAPPPENSKAVKILAALWLVFVALGIIAAVVAPDLQQYLPKQQ